MMNEKTIQSLQEIAEAPCSDRGLSPEEKEEIVFRPAQAGDAAFICSGWLKSYRASSTTWGISNETYYAHHHDIVVQLVLNGAVLVATLKKDPSFLIGFICYGLHQTKKGPELVIHYIYIKSKFQKLGLAKLLFDQVMEIENRDDMRISFTHRTKPASEYVKNHPKVEFENKSILLEFNPYLIQKFANQPTGENL